MRHILDRTQLIQQKWDIFLPTRIQLLLVSGLVCCIKQQRGGVKKLKAMQDVISLYQNPNAVSMQYVTHHGRENGNNTYSWGQAFFNFQ